MTLQLEEAGARLYITGNTFPIKDKIKAAGGHWDGERKQWWIGKAKRAAAEAIIAKATAASSSTASTDGEVYEGEVLGKIEYKGRTYYVRWAGRTSAGKDACRLVSFDGKLNFWADASECRWVKRYTQGYTGTLPTLRSIRKFVADGKPIAARSAYGDAGWRGNGCSDCKRLGDWCPRCAFDEFDN